MKCPLLSLALVSLISACGQNAQNPNFSSGFNQMGQNQNCFAGGFNYPACLSFQGVNNTCSSFNSTPIYEGSQLIGYRSRQTLIGTNLSQNTAQGVVVSNSTQVNPGEKIFVNFDGAALVQPNVTCLLGGFASWVGPAISEPLPSSAITVVTPDGNLPLSDFANGQGRIMQNAGTVHVRVTIEAQCSPVQTVVQFNSGNAGAVEVERCCTNGGVVASCPL